MDFEQHLVIFGLAIPIGIILTLIIFAIAGVL
jgi:hypothetical protein